MLYTTIVRSFRSDVKLFYQDFKDTFVCYTQHSNRFAIRFFRCFIRILKILLYAIHNQDAISVCRPAVVLSGF